MGHEFETGFTVGEAWHGLSKVVQESLTMEQAFVESGLDWLVDLEPVYVLRGDQFISVPDYRGVTRQSDLKVLSVQSDEYAPIQNIEPFKFFNVLIGDGAVKFHSGGSLRGGKEVWALLDVKDSGLSLDGMPDDKLYPYIFARTSHDGSCSFDVSFCFTRVVCKNTFRLATNEGGSTRVRVYHRGDVQSGIAEAQRMFAATNRVFPNYNRVINELAAVPAPAGAIDALAEKLFPALTGEDAKSKLKVRHRDDKVLALKAAFRAETLLLPQYTQTGASCWTLFNAVTRVADHNQRVRITEKRLTNAGGDRQRATNEVRFESGLVGRADAFKQEGVALVLELAGVKA